jgi:hypothetical protein
MYNELRSTTLVNQNVILALSGLAEERLEDCATEIQVDLEVFDVDHGKDIQGPLSPEEFFEAFGARRIRFRFFFHR